MLRFPHFLLSAFSGIGPFILYFACYFPFPLLDMCIFFSLSMHLTMSDNNIHAHMSDCTRLHIREAPSLLLTNMFLPIEVAWFALFTSSPFAVHFQGYYKHNPPVQVASSCIHSPHCKSSSLSRTPSRWKLESNRRVSFPQSSSLWQLTDSCDALPMETTGHTVVPGLSHGRPWLQIVCALCPTGTKTFNRRQESLIHTAAQQ